VLLEEADAYLPNKAHDGAALQIITVVADIVGAALM
jgi:hypothetical protein